MKLTTFAALASFALPASLAPSPQALALPLPASRLVTLTDTDNNTPVTVHPGDTLVVKLGSHADGGYAWNLIYQPGTDGEPPLLKFLRHTHIGGGRRPGASGSDVFRFTVSNALGETTSATWLRLLDLRPWEPSLRGATPWQVHVTVRPSRAASS